MTFRCQACDRLQRCHPRTQQDSLLCPDCNDSWMAAKENLYVEPYRAYLRALEAAKRELWEQWIQTRRPQ